MRLLDVCLDVGTHTCDLLVHSAKSCVHCGGASAEIECSDTGKASNTERRCTEEMRQEGRAVVDVELNRKWALHVQQTRPPLTTIMLFVSFYLLHSARTESLIVCFGDFHYNAGDIGLA